MEKRTDKIKSGGRVGNIRFENLEVLRGVFLLTRLSANSPNLGRFVKLYFSIFFSLSRFIPTFSDFGWRLRLGGRAVRVVRKKPEATKTLFLRSEKLIGGGKTRWSKRNIDVGSSLAVLAKPSMPGRAAAVNETG